MMGVSVRFVAWAGAALVVANVGYEFLLPLLNTRDPVDAAYGIAGALLGFAWLWTVRRFGAAPIPSPARGAMGRAASTSPDSSVDAGAIANILSTPPRTPPIAHARDHKHVDKRKRV